jgi:hypothetical protein
MTNHLIFQQNVICPATIHRQDISKRVKRFTLVTDLTRLAHMPFSPLNSVTILTDGMTIRVGPVFPTALRTHNHVSERIAEGTV